MKMKHVLVGVVAMLAFAATKGNSQTVAIAAMGSSAMFLEVGQAAATSLGCVWTGAKGDVIANDTRVSPTVQENGTVWVAWSVGGGTSCSAPGASSTIYLYLNTDSVLGNRCFFASPRCSLTVKSGLAGTTGSDLLGTGFTDTTIPSAIVGPISTASINVAATDIRPEDARFATLRALTACGQAISGSQYLGLGYQTGTTGVGDSIVQSSQSSGGTASTFHILDFNLTGKDPISGATLPGSFTVVPVGATPVVVVVNPSDGSGFGNLLIQNVDRATLAGYLDGTYGRVQDMIPEAYQGTGGQVGTTVFIREPVSGTYNTMEYAIPNSAQNQSSQEIGLQTLAAVNNGYTLPPDYCSGSGSTATWESSQNPLEETNVTRGSVSSNRFRAIGTGNMVASVLATTDSLGYAFWSAANFANATSTTGKYLTVDGIDPIQETWSDGLIPTSKNGLLGNVTLSHVKDGTYPIWSLLRMVADPASASAVATLVTDAANFLSPAQPDFVSPGSLTIVRSHFAPPGVTFPSPNSAGLATSGQPCNGTSSACAEAGGDVAGLVYSKEADANYDVDTGAATGNINHRQ